MKRLILSSTLLLMVLGVSAQTERISAPESGEPSSPQSVTVVIPSPEIAKPRPTYDWTAHRHNVSISVGLPGLYSTLMGNHSWEFYIAAPSSTTTTKPSEWFCGAWAIDYAYQVKRWLRVGGTANYEYWYGNYNTHDVSLMVKVDFTYINKENIRLYSGIATGIGMHLEQNNSGAVAGMYIPAVALTPIGLNFGGERVYGLVETNIGASSFVRVGVGFRP